MDQTYDSGSPPSYTFPPGKPVFFLGPVTFSVPPAGLGITAVNGELGPTITLAAGVGISVTVTGPNTIEIANTGGGGGITDINGETGPSISILGTGITVSVPGPNQIGLTNDAVLSIAKSGDPALSGVVTLSAGANVTLTQVGQNIQIAASGSTPQTPSYVKITTQTNQNVTSIATPLIAWDAAAPIFSSTPPFPGANNTQFVLPGGFPATLYEFNVSVQWSPGGASVFPCTFGIAVRLNGVNVIANSVAAPVAVGDFTQACNGTVLVSPGDIVTVIATQNSGDTAQILFDDSLTYVCATAQVS